MMNVFFKQGGGVCRKDISSTDSLDLPQEVLWIDLLHPSTAEVSHIAQTYTLDIPTKEEREEIEQSARYFEDTQSITINTYFLMRSASMDLQNETVTFILFQGILFTIRYADFKVFGEIQQSVLLSPRSFEDGYDILSKIFEVRVEQDADMLEGAAQLTKLLRKAVFDEEASDHTAQLAKLSNLQEFNLSVRDSLFDKRRAITALLKSYKVDPEIKKDLSIVLKDLNSLVEFTTVNLNMLDNTQSLFASRVNIEQNKIIKLFTVATMAMMPPHL